jgi:hypothetical protein
MIDFHIGGTQGIGSLGRSTNVLFTLPGESGVAKQDGESPDLGASASGDESSSWYGESDGGES